jgi:putative hydrolase of the HAD superfamily
MKNVLFVFDLDGVILENSFPSYLDNRYGINKDMTASFFKKEYRQCQIGLLDLKQELPSFLKTWGWKSSVKEFLDIWFKTDLKCRKFISKTIEEISKSGNKIYIASNQEIYRTKFIEEKLYILKYITESFYSYKLGYLKPNPKFFHYIDKKIREDKSSIVYVDDNNINLSTAKAFGWKTLKFVDSKAFNEKLKSYF